MRLSGENRIGFYTNLDESVLQSGNKLKVFFVLPDGSKITTDIILRWFMKLKSEKIVDGTPCNYYCGVEFCEIDKMMQEQIIKYVHQREQEEIKKLIEDDTEWDTF